MLALLEEIGAIDRKNMYQIQSETLGENSVMASAQEEKVIFVSKNNQVELIQTNWYNDIKEHLKNEGMIRDEDISIVIKVKRPC